MDFYKSRQYSSKGNEDSDSGVSTVAVEQQDNRAARQWDSAFEDDAWSLTSSCSSSVSSVHSSHEAYWQQMRKLKSFGDICNIAREMLQTERTFVKDLEVFIIYFRNVVENGDIDNNQLMEHIIDNLDPLYHCHCSLMSELAGCSSRWEKGLIPEVDHAELIIEVIHRKMKEVTQNVQHIMKHEDVILQLEAALKSSLKFKKAYEEFELNPLCYLSLNSFLLKPIQRLFSYQNMLERLVNDQNQHADNINARAALEELVNACKVVDKCRHSMQDLNILIELERSLMCVDELAHPKRQFIREGCLHKICRKGPEPRMFFLLSDVLLYTKPGMSSTHQFCARAALPLYVLKIEDGGVQLQNLYSFTIIDVVQGKSLIVAASSPGEKTKWMDDLLTAINAARRETICERCGANKREFISFIKKNNDFLCSSCLKDVSKLENINPEERVNLWQKKYPPNINIKQITNDESSMVDETYSVNDEVATSNRRTVHSHSISTRKVCWQRYVSIGIRDYMVSQENNFSGYLRRRYKNTRKWQRMWTVFTNFCLYFFKNCDESVPFANLTLTGYVVSQPYPSEVPDNFAFKLQFKTHVSIFKADREYDFKRWMEVLTISTENKFSCKLENITSQTEDVGK